jgi:thiosulfate/3-mercaptopyruvate sulfurtransferase
MMRAGLEFKQNILVSCHYVYRNLTATSKSLIKNGNHLSPSTNIRVLDGTWNMPNSSLPNAYESFLKEHVPSALFFDIDKISANTEAVKENQTPIDLPHMLPSEKFFEKCVSEMGVSNDDHVVIYDQHGLFSACRVWYTFKVFGHDQVSVMDGGLPRWKECGYPVESGTGQQTPQPTQYRANFHAELIKDLKQIQAIIQDNSYTIIDARPKGRFIGTDPEPRPGNISGHMPGAINIPYNTLLNPNGTFKSEADIRQIFNNAGVHVDETGAVEKPIVSSCGSGITACVLLYALNLLGVKFDRLNLYDGSWAEYGNPKNQTTIIREEK